MCWYKQITGADGQFHRVRCFVFVPRFKLFCVFFFLCILHCLKALLLILPPLQDYGRTLALPWRQHVAPAPLGCVLHLQALGCRHPKNCCTPI